MYPGVVLIEATTRGKFVLTIGSVAILRDGVLALDGLGIGL